MISSTYKEQERQLPDKLPLQSCTYSSIYPTPAIFERSAAKILNLIISKFYQTINNTNKVEFLVVLFLCLNIIIKSIL